MFTGIVRHVGVVRQARSKIGGKRVIIDLGPLVEGLVEGGSVAVNGACLTVTSINQREAAFDVVAETLSRSTLGSLRTGSRVNLELPLRLTDALDGHMVQGHVDGTAVVRSVRSIGQHTIEFAAGKKLVGQMVLKGSACIDGVSLTLVEVSSDAFSVALVPTTLAETTLGGLVPGAKVNVETDVIGKYVLKYLEAILQKGRAGVTLDKLGEAGFL